MARALAWAVGLLALAAIPSLMPNAYVQYVVNSSLIIAFATIGLNVIFGYAGQHAFGFPVFFGVGAYASALLAVDTGWPIALSIPAAAIATGAISAVIGLPSFRLRGIYFGVATIAFSYVIYIVAQNWVDLTRGPMGIPLIPPLKVFSDSIPFISHETQVRIAVIAVIGLVIWALDRLLGSSAGRAWLAVRENENLASSLGISPLRYQMAAFILGAAISGLGGGFYAHYVGFISPTELGFHYIGVVFIMLIAGGTSTLAGPLIGSIVFGLVPELLRVAEMARSLLLGLILLLCIAVIPEGLSGVWQRLSATSIGRRLGLAVAGKSKAMARRSGEAVGLGQLVPAVAENGAVEVQGVCKQFDGLVALSDVSFSIQPCEVVGLIGPNGAGKTTLFNIMTGVLAPSSGSVRYCGREIVGLAPHAIAARGVTRTYQITSLFPELTVSQNVRIATHLWSCRNPLAALFRTKRFRQSEEAIGRAVDRILDLVGLQSNRDANAAALAYGDQRRLEVAIALATGARLILLDEPAAGLVSEETDKLCELIVNLKKAGFTVVVIEHDMRMVMRLCSRIIVLNYGRKIFDGAPQAAAADPDVIEAYLGAAAENA